jgi:GTP-binding protein
MLVKDAFLHACEVDIGKYPADGLFEIVLIGKSNVGKSSFINAMTGRKALARTSGAPGKTRTANFYRINDAFYFVDMPGYGYAEVSKAQKASFETIIKTYLRRRKSDFAVFFLLDSRHAPTVTTLRHMRL